MALDYMDRLSKLTRPLMTATGQEIAVWSLQAPKNVSHLRQWAKHFRQHYCADSEIDALREGTGLSRAEYLTQLIFPDEKVSPGPSIRAGDFAEILIADYVEYLLNFWVPRGKYAEKASRDESVKGVDILGFRMSSSTHQPTDTLLAFEVKAQLSDGQYTGALQKAIDDSSKDTLRRAFTLNATKRRLLKAGQNTQALVVQRFQNLSDNPYVYRSGAAAVLSDAAYDKVALKQSDVSAHRNKGALELIVIKGKDLMTLVHALYQRAANEA